MNGEINELILKLANQLRKERGFATTIKIADVESVLEAESILLEMIEEQKNGTADKERS